MINARVLASSRPVSRLVTIQVTNGKVTKIRNQRRFERKTNPSDFDAAGRLVLPGFIDCHCHMFSVGEQGKEVSLFGSKSISDLQKRILDFEQQANFLQRGDWVLGRGWDQDRFQEKRMPKKEDLDALLIKRPLVMVRVCGHIAVLNSLALEEFKKAGAFQSEDEETVERNNRGEPSGIVKESALAECWKVLKETNLEELKKQFLSAQDIALHLGVLAVHCILSENWQKELEAIRQLDGTGELVIKSSLLLPVEAVEYVEKLGSARDTLLRGKRFGVIGFKLFADGSLGARTAALNEPYGDDPTNAGILNYDETKVIQIAKRVKRLRLILAAHAIGDRAVEQIIRSFRKGGITKRDGFRIEHVSVVSRRIISSLGIPILSVQPMFARSDYWIRDRIGADKRKRFAYAFKTLSKRNKIVGGSDAPVETLDPLKGIEAAADNPTSKAESLTLMNSIALYTSNAAAISPITEKSGRIKVGNDCDLVILNKNKVQHIFASTVDAVFTNGQRLDL
jgi:predicted amidohydrolase YtcJ